jgi:polyhydroxyalkanoate synthesis regulator phasin
VSDQQATPQSPPSGGQDIDELLKSIATEKPDKANQFKAILEMLNSLPQEIRGDIFTDSPIKHLINLYIAKMIKKLLSESSDEDNSNEMLLRLLVDLLKERSNMSVQSSQSVSSSVGSLKDFVATVKAVKNITDELKSALSELENLGGSPNREVLERLEELEERLRQYANPPEVQALAEQRKNMIVETVIGLFRKLAEQVIPIVVEGAGKALNASSTPSQLDEELWRFYSQQYNPGAGATDPRTIPGTIPTAGTTAVNPATGAYQPATQATPPQTYAPPNNQGVGVGYSGFNIQASSQSSRPNSTSSGVFTTSVVRKEVPRDANNSLSEGKSLDASASVSEVSSGSSKVLGELATSQPKAEGSTGATDSTSEPNPTTSADGGEAVHIKPTRVNFGGTGITLRGVES